MSAFRAILIYFFMTCSNINWAQEDYIDVLQSYFANETGPVYVVSEYAKLFDVIEFDTISLAIFLNEHWEPLPHKNIPDKKPFIADISISDLVAYSHNEPVGEIDFGALGDKFVGIDYHYSPKGDQIIHRISKPYLSKNKEWSLFFGSSYSKYASSSGVLFIYRKVDGQWERYHRIELWMP